MVHERIFVKMVRKEKDVSQGKAFVRYTSEIRASHVM